MNKKVKILLLIFVILAGVFMFIYAGVDDSPGGQLIGVVVVIGAIVGWVKSKKKNS